MSTYSSGFNAGIMVGGGIVSVVFALILFTVAASFGVDTPEVKTGTLIICLIGVGGAVVGLRNAILNRGSK